MPDLDDRSKTLLKALIERYISDGQPVGSRTLARHCELELSAATIRNVMSDLEDLGYISSPHCSAGRVPTPQGYRLFIDRLLAFGAPDGDFIRHVSKQLPSEQPPEQLLEKTSQLLSNLSHFAGIVQVPKKQGLRIAQFEFLRLSEQRILMILVTEDGSIQNRILFTKRPYAQQDLAEAANFLNTHYANHTMDRLQNKLSSEVRKLRRNINELMMQAIQEGKKAVQDNPANPYVLTGEKNLLAVEDWESNLDNLRHLFDLFEKKTCLIHLLDDSSRANGVQIFIGKESGIEDLGDCCSIITAPYGVNETVIGTLGVIGPTRMAYHHIIPIVNITAKILSSALSARCAPPLDKPQTPESTK